MNPEPFRPAFDAVWTPRTTATEMGQWVVAARDQQPRRFRVLVDYDFAGTTHKVDAFPIWERLFRGMFLLRDMPGSPRLGVDFFLPLERADAFHTGVLGVLLGWLNRSVERRRLLVESRDPFVQWVRDWAAERHWPRHVFLGVRVRDEEHYHSQRNEFTCPARRLSAQPPQVWIWWPDVAEAGTDLRFHPLNVPNGVRDVFRRRQEAQEESQQWRRLVTWIVCGGRYAADLARMGTDYRCPVWVARDEHNPAGVQWTPGERPTMNAEVGTGNAETAAMKCPHCKSGLLWSEDRGPHCDGCDDFNPETDIPSDVETAENADERR